MLDGRIELVNHRLTANLSTEHPLSGTVSKEHTLSGSVSIDILDFYTGPTTITPRSTAQTLETTNKTLLKNITINPIPSNYGLISWNGSVLTVS